MKPSSEKNAEALFRIAVVAWLTTSCFWLVVGFVVGFIVGLNW